MMHKRRYHITILIGDERHQRESCVVDIRQASISSSDGSVKLSLFNKGLLLLLSDAFA